MLELIHRNKILQKHHIKQLLCISQQCVLSAHRNLSLKLHEVQKVLSEVKSKRKQQKLLTLKTRQICEIILQSKHAFNHGKQDGCLYKDILEIETKKKTIRAISARYQLFRKLIRQGTRDSENVIDLTCNEILEISDIRNMTIAKKHKKQITEDHYQQLTRMLKQQRSYRDWHQHLEKIEVQPALAKEIWDFYVASLFRIMEQFENQYSVAFIVKTKVQVLYLMYRYFQASFQISATGQGRVQLGRFLHVCCLSIVLKYHGKADCNWIDAISSGEKYKMWSLKNAKLDTKNFSYVLPEECTTLNFCLLDMVREDLQVPDVSASEFTEDEFQVLQKINWMIPLTFADFIEEISPDCTLEQHTMLADTTCLVMRRLADSMCVFHEQHHLMTLFVLKRVFDDVDDDILPRWFKKDAENFDRKFETFLHET